jgi:hypothetical protein
MAKFASTDYAPPGGPRQWYGDFESHG